MAQWSRWALAGLSGVALLGLLVVWPIWSDEACGNGALEPGEACDPGLHDAVQCSDLSNLLVGGTVHCGAECSWDLTACETGSAVCGDGTVEGSESCDPPGNEMECSELVANASGGSAVCSRYCEWDVGECGAEESVCGDGSVDAGELCDDGNRVNGDGCSRTCVPELDGEAVHFDGPAVDIRLLSVAGRSLCWDTAEQRDSRDHGPIPLEYQLLICELPSGETAYPIERIRASMERVREAFARAGIDLREAGIERVSLGRDCAITRGADELASLVEGARAAHRIPLVFGSRISGRSSGGPVMMGFADFGFGVFMGTTRASVVIHELGHFFGLLHTHSCVDSITGDRVVDTPHDPGPSWLPLTCRDQQPQECPGGCGNSACSGGSTPERANYMSYHHPCQKRFAQEQVQVIRCMLGRDLAWFRSSGERPPAPRPTFESQRCVRSQPIGPGRIVGSTFGRSESYGGSGYPEGSTDVLYELRTSSAGLHCVELLSREPGTVMTIRDGCEWDAAILASNIEGERRLRSSLTVVMRDGEPAWLAVDQWGFSSGHEFELQVREGMCGGARLPAPTLLEPGASAVLSSRPIGLRWTSVPGADRYELRLGPDAASLREPEPCSQCFGELVDATAVELPGLPYEGQTFWTVRAVQGDRPGPFAQTRWFELRQRRETAPPSGPAPSQGFPPSSAPIPRYPLRQDVLETLTDTFTWNEVKGAEWYETRLGLDADIAGESCTRCLQRRVYRTEFQPDPRLVAASLADDEFELSWTVRAGNAHGAGPFARPVSGLAVEPWLCTAVFLLKVPSETEYAALPEAEDDLTSFCGGASSAENVWLLVPETSEVICIETEGASFDTVLSVRRHCEQEETEIVCGGYQLELSVEANRPYFVIVDGAGPEDYGIYRLSIRTGPCSR